MNSRKRFIAGAVSAALAAILCTGAGTAAARGIDPRVRFDNPYIPAHEAGSRYLEIDVEAPGEEGYVPDRGYPMNLVLVLDRSGSMDTARKWEYVMETAMEIVSRLDEDDTFSLVTFSDWVNVDIPASPVSYPRRLHEAMARIHPGGSTNLGEGLMAGYREARRHFREEGINRILLLTDGLANRGITDSFRLTDMAASESERGIVLSTFGVGYEYNEDLLANLADAGRGTYYYIASPDRIPEMLSREFGQAAGAVYLDVTVIIRLEPHCRFERVMGYPWRMEGRDVIVHLGDLPPGAHRQVIVELGHPSAGPGRFNVGDVDLSYRSRGDNSGVTRRKTSVSLEVTDNRSKLSSGQDDQVKKRAVLARANEQMDRAAKLADRKEYKEAQKTLADADKILKESPVTDSHIKEKQSMIRRYSGALSAAPTMSPAAAAAMQKETKYELYEERRSPEE